MFYCYILRSIESKKLYIGYTDNWKRRLTEHNAGKNSATKPYAPYELIFCGCFINKNDALACEKYYKSTSGWKRIHNMLSDTLRDCNPSKNK